MELHILMSPCLVKVPAACEGFSSSCRIPPHPPFCSSLLPHAPLPSLISHWCRPLFLLTSLLLVISHTQTHTFTFGSLQFSPPFPKPSLRLSPAVAVVTVCSPRQAPAVPKQTVNSLITHLLIPPSFLTSALAASTDWGAS